MRLLEPQERLSKLGKQPQLAVKPPEEKGVLSKIRRASVAKVQVRRDHGQGRIRMHSEGLASAQRGSS